MARGAAVGARTQERTGRRGRGAREGVEVAGSVSYGHRLGTRAHTIRFPIRMPAQALHYHLANRPVWLQHFEHILRQSGSDTERRGAPGYLLRLR